MPLCSRRRCHAERRTPSGLCKVGPTRGAPCAAAGVAGRLESAAAQLEAARRAKSLGQLTRLLRGCVATELPEALRQQSGGDGARPHQAAGRLADEVCKAAAAIRSQLSCASLPDSKQGVLAAEAREALGASALCLSGGGMLGVYHMGVVKCLFELGALPQHICGTSVGAIFGAFVATHTDVELRPELELPRILFGALGPERGPFPLSYWRVTWNWLRRGFMYDYSYQYNNQAQVVSRGLTFAEAHARTGRTLTITCVPAEGGPVLLLNRHTAPDVLIASAICASCAMPFLIEAVQLLERAPGGGARPWSAVPVAARFRDGTLGKDVPVEQLREQLNVRWTTVSQVNPHVVPLEWPRRCARRVAEGEAGEWLRCAGRALLVLEAWLRAALWALLCVMQRATGIPRPGGWIHALLFQDYAGGDVNVLHTQMRLVDYYRSLKNERTMEEFADKLEAARSETLRHAQRLRLRTEVEQAVQQALPDTLVLAELSAKASPRADCSGERPRRRQRRGAAGREAGAASRQLSTRRQKQEVASELSSDVLPGLIAAA